MDKKQIVVYWAPAFKASDNSVNWSLLYSEPSSLFVDLNKNRRKETKAEDNFLSCPASSSRFRNTYMFKNTVESSYKFDGPTGQTEVLGDKGIFASIIRPPSIKDNILIKLSLNWIFFTEEESLSIHLNPPYFSGATHLQYGALCPGGFDIGKWFRVTSTEINLWEGVNEFKLKEDEPIFYAEFISDSPIVLKKFVLTDELLDLAYSSRVSTSHMGKWLPLSARYKQFKRSRHKELILKKIKENLI
jgi:hypothetical protein